MQYPASEIAQDNAGVINNVLHKSSNNKGLIRITRVVSHLRSFVDTEIILPVKVAAEEQCADLLTKQITSPTAHWWMVEHILGPYPDLLAKIACVEAKCNKRAHAVPVQREQADVFPVNTAVGPYTEPLTWMESASQGVRHMMKQIGIYSTTEKQNQRDASAPNHSTALTVCTKIFAHLRTQRM
jgi:hypothetical protein